MYMRKWQFFFGIAFIFLLVASCRQDDGVHQNIDQTINFYFQDTNGKDLIIPNDPEGYAGKITYVDDFSINNNATVSGITSGVDASKKNYMQYIAGATRRVSKDSTATSKTYTSRLFINYSKRTNNDTKVMPQDTLDIVYSWTPSLFNVSTISVNKKVVFNSSSGQQKNITITKK
ncbi:hypothetical protein EAVNNN508_01805 [Elizabethkingia anophelis]|nr:hypothetical protein EAVNVB490_02692 [Elizabethkingia anophelis]CAI9671454.1 hypothetical protein EAVNNN508_02540 [Elizabethkingia anophelis]CAI9674427.1 hypothetical protein EAVNVB490_01808 [Elizabethkingia anophelis]CAI9681793.1 hypothetical protein EAVNNN508_01805 [Elizabethkingia anophelis]